MTEEGASIEESFFNFIKEHWIWIAIIVLGFFVWKFNLVMGVLSLTGTAFLGWVAWKFWIHYIQQDFISGIDFVLLEIIPPREVLRSPKAMELFITNALYHWSMKGGKEQYWQGAVWFWFSLEIASIDGQVHFYIRTPTRVKGLIETQIYAQYPQAQIKTVEDYTLAVDEISSKSDWNGWGCEFALVKPEAYPIKTYVDFGLDKDPDEEFKVDPISPVIELFGSLQKGEQMWMQIVITPSKKEYGTWFGKHDWVEEARNQQLKFLKPYTKIHDEGERIEVRVPDYLKKTVEGMVSKVSKIGFDTGIRVMYMGKKEAFDMNNRRNIRLIFRQYERPDSNAFTRVNSTQADAFNTQFFPLSSEKVMILANRMLHEFQERSFFHLPMRHILNNHTIPKFLLFFIKQFWLPYFHPSTFVLNVEELATLWHFPGQILKVPTLERIESKEASPPTNLPI
ncbi:MAG: hypothetical protein UU13_C0001G0052 [Candidatus Nomurabacteria bacterium GW2011_GWB1_40_7]|uniref:DUF8128 domain-containing protein n=1 Tax=Candidatus Nomurabacteria bacterium GW2011_GWB1_40_7 TaxID=1618744 RepID=A0A0G0T1C7_9BACT|nr:MAG: hypothetical protein UU13_C0001G0052 [Candidatus Nomurabacteria bacterium GW2011_GWB1_40_7]